MHATSILGVMLLSVVTFGANPAHSELAQEEQAHTTGACSPVAPYNKGEITIKCAGFSKEQSSQILALLQRLSKQQSSDRVILLKKIEEVLATVRATQQQAQPRTIPGELRAQILRSNWGVCYPSPVVITAPTDDIEAQGLADQLRSLLSQAGFKSTLRYDKLAKVQGNKEDFKIVSHYLDYCIPNYLIDSFEGRFLVGYEGLKDANESSVPPTGKDRVTFIYVYRR